MHPGEQAPDKLLAAETGGQQVMVKGLLQGRLKVGPQPRQGRGRGDPPPENGSTTEAFAQMVADPQGIGDGRQ